MTIQDETAVGGQPVDLRGESPPVRAALSALGRLLGAALVDAPHSLRSFVAEHLRSDPFALASVNYVLIGIDAPLVKVLVAGILDRAPSAVLSDDAGASAPGYELVNVGVGEHVAAPDDLAAYVPAAEGFGFDVVIVLTWERGNPLIALHVRRDDHARARDALSSLIADARGSENFYRGCTLQVIASDNGVRFVPIEASSVRREDLIHASSVWAEVDANVGGLARHGEVLRAAGLGASRGLLIVGPPGVGKTALCRVIASELPEGTSILVVEGGASARGLGLLYDSLSRLAPAAVFLDDIDLLAGDRRSGGAGGALGELLTHLDGFTPSAAVLTVATTNVVDAIDPALIRAGRFDSVIEIGPPDLAAREQVLRRYLRPLGDFDVSRIAAATEGASGSDLREVVRRAVLERGVELSESYLLDVVRTGRWKPAPLTGQYL